MTLCHKSAHKMVDLLSGFTIRIIFHPDVGKIERLWETYSKTLTRRSVFLVLKIFWNCCPDNTQNNSQMCTDREMLLNLYFTISRNYQTHFKNLAAYACKILKQMSEIWTFEQLWYLIWLKRIQFRNEIHTHHTTRNIIFLFVGECGYH